MGWDAHSSANIRLYSKSPVLRLTNHRLRKIFQLAADQVRIKTGNVDGFLAIGSLDSSDCCTYLQLNTGRSCYDEDGWSSEEVERISRTAKWSSVDCNEEDLWAYESAKAFLEICAQEKLSISFSW